MSLFAPNIGSPEPKDGMDALKAEEVVPNPALLGNIELLIPNTGTLEALDELPPREGPFPAANDPPNRDAGAPNAGADIAAEVKPIPEDDMAEPTDGTAPDPKRGSPVPIEGTALPELLGPLETEGNDVLPGFEIADELLPNAGAPAPKGATPWNVIDGLIPNVIGPDDDGVGPGMLGVAPDVLREKFGPLELLPFLATDEDVSGFGSSSLFCEVPPNTNVFKLSGVDWGTKPGPEKGPVAEDMGAVLTDVLNLNAPWDCCLCSED